MCWPKWTSHSACTKKVVMMHDPVLGRPSATSSAALKQQYEGAERERATDQGRWCSSCNSLQLTVTSRDTSLQTRLESCTSGCSPPEVLHSAEGVHLVQGLSPVLLVGFASARAARIVPKCPLALERVLVCRRCGTAFYDQPSFRFTSSAAIS